MVHYTGKYKIIENFFTFFTSIAGHYLGICAKDQTVVDEIKVSIDFELFETERVEDNPLLFMVENKRGTLLSHPVTKEGVFKYISKYLH